MKLVILSIILLSLYTNTLAQKVQIDQRALNYYSQKQVAKMPDIKIKQINFLYQESFIIPTEFKDLISSSDININDYSNMRKIDKREKVYLKTENQERESDVNTSIFFYLLSINELQKAYKNIK